MPTMCKFALIRRGFSALLFGGLCSFMAHANEPMVTVADVKAWNKGQIQVINCEISSPFLTVLSSENNAQLTALLPRGSKVKKGELIARQQDYYLQQELLRLREEKTIHHAELQLYRAEYERLLALKTLTSKGALDSAYSLMVKSQASYQKAINNIEELEYRLTKLQFFAPEDGTIVETFAQKGEFLSKGRNLLSFLSQEDKELSCQVPAEQFTHGEHLTFSLQNNNLPLSAVRVEESVELSTQMAKVHLKSSVPLTKLLLGQRVKVELQIKQPSLTQLPADAILLSQNGNYVWKVNQEGVVSKVNVSVKSNHDYYFVVDSLLKPGDKVVTTGKTRLKPRQKVELKSLERAI